MRVQLLAIKDLPSRRPACRFAHPIRPHLAIPAHARPMRVGFTTICVPTALHDTLAALKVHPRQAFHEVIAAALASGPEVERPP